MADEQRYVIVYKSRFGGGGRHSQATSYPLDEVKNLCDHLNKLDWEFIYWYEPIQQEKGRRNGNN